MFVPRVSLQPLPSRSALMRQRGFTLVELMVSVVISLLVVLAALSSSQFFMRMQRQSVGIGAAVANTVTAFATLKYEAAQAGMGFYDKGKLACTRFNISKGGAAVVTDASVLPVSITTVLGVPTLNLAYATALEAASSTTLVADTSNNATGAQIASYLPVGAGQSVLMVPTAPATPCSIKTVTGITDSTGTGQTLQFDSIGDQNQVAFPSVTYASGDSVLLMGSLQSVSFTVDALNHLVMVRPFDATSAVLAKNIVAIAMQYGISEVGRNTVFGWRYPMSYPLLATGAEDWSTLTAANISAQVKAIKIAVLVRSEQLDRKVDGLCATTQAMPSLLGTVLGQSPSAGEGLAAGVVVNPALKGDWGCYRYAETSIVVPLRNLILGPKT